jgi:hypothetical protein
MHEVIASVGFSLDAIRAARASFAHGQQAGLPGRRIRLGRLAMILSSGMIEREPSGERAEC